MVQRHSRTPQDYVQWVSKLLAQQGSYGVVSAVSQRLGVARQTLYRWKAKGEAALQAAFSQTHPAAEQQCPLERAILTLLVEGHASYRGIQRCLWTRLRQHLSLGQIAAVVQSAGKRAQDWISQHAPDNLRALALDELYGSKHGQAYLNVVDAHSGAVWASTSPVAVDGESWTLVLWQLQGLCCKKDDAVVSSASLQEHQRSCFHEPAEPVQMASR